MTLEEEKETADASAPRRARKKAAPSLYAEHQKVQPRSVSGTFRVLKWASNLTLVPLFILGPWLRWDRGPGVPDQAIFLDMAGRRGYFLSIEIWPQEVYYLTGLLLLGAIGLFLATALLGRVWCGFTCIQTVYTDIFQFIEAVIEGDRLQRLRLDKAPWTAGKLAKKAATNAVWLLVSLIVSVSWIFYFNDAPTTARALLDGSAPLGLYGFVGLFAASTFLFAGYAREQVCIYMCPWPRFQASMFDEDSLIVTYETWRGEPRGPAKAGQSFDGRGHCVDCTMCYQVCPTGIDIRDGSQLACIGCGLCIDACNGIMEKMGLPPGLITYDSTNNQLARSKGTPTRLRLVRSRTLIYGALLAAVAAVMAFGLWTRSTLEVNVLHERSPLYVPMSDGSIRNGYTLKILNMGRAPQVYVLRVQGIEGASLSVVGYGRDGATEVDLPVPGDSVGSFRVYVSAPRKGLKGKNHDLAFVLSEKTGGLSRTHAALFAGPGGE
ncbi:MAG: cytochrome c oxidase accessory protein CcoG [Alphaproteobacteria bacterium]|nr:cytochrome c oxidase accessory protein CcoG [Alphaproteobacteria bacterium]